MGNSSWSASTTRAYNAINTARAHKTREEVFKQRDIAADFDPLLITVRESRDSEANPESTAIILALDVTGSMGMIPEYMARKGLAPLVEAIHEKRPVSDPHIMIMGIGDHESDDAPLQASQFEADIKISEELDKLYLEGGGGGNHHESYDLPWLFAAEKTSIDCWEKRGKKGYLFTMGDECPPPGIRKAEALRVLGIKSEVNYGASEVLLRAQERYHTFHLIIEEGSYASTHMSKVLNSWENLLGRRAIKVSDYKCLPEIIIAVMRVNEGEEAEAVLQDVTGAHSKKVVRHALALEG